MRRIGRDINDLALSQNRFGAAENEFDFALENSEHLLEIMTMRRRTASRRDEHVNEAVAARSIIASEQNRVCVSPARAMWGNV